MLPSFAPILWPQQNLAFKSTVWPRWRPALPANQPKTPGAEEAVLLSFFFRAVFFLKHTQTHTHT